MFSSKALSLLALLAIEMPFVASAVNPTKMAVQTRFDLSSKAVNLMDGTVEAGNGKMQRMNWVSSEAKSRGYTANFAVSHYAWSEAQVRFVPDVDGLVELKLMGPWEQASPGQLYQEEVLWDKISVIGSSITNGSFEQGMTGWSGGIIEARETALDGSSVGRTWHNRALTTALIVRGGVPVTLTLFAKAALPEGFKEMRRFPKTSSAFAAAVRFRRGANLGNYLEAPPGQDWGMHYTKEDFADFIINSGAPPA